MNLHPFFIHETLFLSSLFRIIWNISLDLDISSSFSELSQNETPDSKAMKNKKMATAHQMMNIIPPLLLSSFLLYPTVRPSLSMFIFLFPQVFKPKKSRDECHTSYYVFPKKGKLIGTIYN
ncbi:hypothetical protein JMN23_06960 [Bacillus sp. RHFB]|nr:hypothetical protein [Bacillus sp. RHFB]